MAKNSRARGLKRYPLILTEKCQAPQLPHAYFHQQKDGFSLIHKRSGQLFPQRWSTDVPQQILEMAVVLQNLISWHLAHRAILQIVRAPPDVLPLLIQR